MVAIYYCMVVNHGCNIYFCSLLDESFPCNLLNLLLDLIATDYWAMVDVDYMLVFLDHACARPCCIHY